MATASLKVNSKLEAKQKHFTELVKREYGVDRTFFTRQEMLAIRAKYKLGRQSWVKDPEFHFGRGKYKLPYPEMSVDLSTPIPGTPEEDPDDFTEEDDEDTDVKVIQMPAKPQLNTTPTIVPADSGLVPKPNPTFVPFGSYEDIYDIIKSRLFFPFLSTGPTRSGKTESILQACAELKRNLYRVNITIETDESDLIGGFRLINGETVWEDGPVIKAMEDPEGGLLMLDEIDLGSNKIMCLQPVYEGNGIFIKKLNRWVYPRPGFNIAATANTKGRGSEDGKYIGTNVMNDALLERLTGATFEHSYPEKRIEVRILNNNLKQFGIADSEFAEPLCQWAENIRLTHKDGGVDETITTGRLIHIIKGYSIFGRNRLKALKLAIARFDENTQSAFLEMYTKIDATAKDGPDNEDKPTLPHHATASGKTLRPW
jgi:hypothetical protein